MIHMCGILILMAMIKRLIGMGNDLYRVFCFYFARRGYHVSCSVVGSFFFSEDHKDIVGLS